MGYNKYDAHFNSEHQLWREVVKGDTSAFEQLVVRYQSAVSAVAYSIVGDFASSQDIAQETFWAAWTTRDRLLDPSRLGAWLCGISRNMARQWRRKKSRVHEVAQSNLSYEPDSRLNDPVDQFISEEEEAVVWKSLEQIPDNYREVLVAYYRQGQSIEQVASTLGLSNAAARQRLSRGREMLRGRVSKMIEGVLDRSNPSQTFTARVMAGIVGAGVTGYSATASAAGVSSAAKVSSSALGAAKLLASGASFGLLGGLLGVAGGFGGTWIGTWLPAQFSPTETERQLLLERARPMIRYAILQAIGTVILTLLLTFFKIHWLYFVVGLASLIIPFVAFAIVHTARTHRLVANLRKEISPEEDPNRSKLAQQVVKKQADSNRRFRGRRFTSQWKLFGVPLIDVQVSDPVTTRMAEDPISQRRVARGWIAIGDVAHGILLAIGGQAVGLVALGGLSVGLFSVGGAAIGVVSLGGVALAYLALGGLAVGYSAVGGGAIGWHSAAGGGAIAYEMAAGGAAVANDFAVGGVAIADEANTALARKMLAENSFSWILETPRLSLWATLLGIAPLLFTPLFYRRGSKEPPLDKKPNS